MPNGNMKGEEVGMLHCRSTNTMSMKHPDTALEAVEFNLGRAMHLVCAAGQVMCGQCDSCQVARHLNSVKKWLHRAGNVTRRRFLIGLLQQLHSVEQLQYILRLLQPLVSSKDFVYARSRAHTSIKTDSANTSTNRSLHGAALEGSIGQLWDWFGAASYWSKSNFLLAILQQCEAHELLVVANQASTLLAAEQRAFMPHDDYETSSIASTNYTYQSNEGDLLTSACPGYSTIQGDPFSPDSDQSQDDERMAYAGSTLPTTPRKASALSFGEEDIINDDSGEEWFADDDDNPMCLVLPGSSKAYSGVARYKDFIRLLPVHLSKLILGMLDQVSLCNCVCVSQHWRLLTEEVHKEFFVQQHLWEEIMLMQGAAAQGCNPVYAKDIDVAVPNIKPHSFEVMLSGNEEISTKFRSEVSYDTGYSGVSTRNIIMEERNVYCGPYNVMVLLNVSDPSRVLSTDGGSLIALGSADRKVRFMACETGKEEGVVISGHAGSVRCVALDQSRGVILSGSYDTSIRKWSLATGKCLKILRGHRDTLLCLQIYQNYVISGAKDNMCKVWDFDTGKCIRTFKHRHPVTAVAIGEEMCISGCEAGKVKVWFLPTGKIIKRLTGHHGAVTGICFDRWHIVTAGKDGYVLVWSAQGNHTRCLIALRHPTEVLSVEFMFLRVITGAADGKLRIWNMITGQCLRIMRGNSRSDPITQLQAIGNRITINTPNNLLVLNFEPIEFDYMLESDKMPPLVQYSKYVDAPVRQQPYPYVRAQRMELAGAANTKLVYHSGGRRSEPKEYNQSTAQASQVPHSAKCLSERCMTAARCIQSAVSAERVRSSRILRPSQSAPLTQKAHFDMQHNSCTAASAGGGTLGEMSRDNLSVKTGDGMDQEGDGQSHLDSYSRKRRVSWAFEHPLKSSSAKQMNLPDTKSLLRSQIRTRGEVMPPDFIYLTVNAIQSGIEKHEPATRMAASGLSKEVIRRNVGRPSSSPSYFDPRSKVSVSQLHIDQLRLDTKEDQSEVKQESETQHQSSVSQQPVIMEPPQVPTTLTIITEFAPKPVETKSATSLSHGRVRSSIPKPRLLRPHTASVVNTKPGQSRIKSEAKRPHSAAVGALQPDLSALKSNMSGLSSLSSASLREKKHSTSAKELSVVPMLMYPQDMAAKLRSLRPHNNPLVMPSDGHVSTSNHPFRTHVNFKLLTHEQVAKLGALSKSANVLPTPNAVATQQSDISVVEALVS